MNTLKKILRFLLPVIVLAIGGALMGLLIATKKEAQRKPAEERGALVEVLEVKPGDQAIAVPAQGTVRAAEQVVVMPEVGGRVLWRNPDLVPGGILAQGESLVKIDSRNSRFALRQQKAQVDRARLELKLEGGRQRVAEREWKLVEGAPDAAGQSVDHLALRKPQLRNAEVAVDAATSALDQAKLNISRANLRAPFNAFVQTAMADRGQLLAPQSQVATLVGIDRFWVQVSLPVSDLRWVRVPGVNAREGSTVRVWQRAGDSRIERRGRIVRLLGELDPLGRMARVLVEIEDPFNLRVEGDPGLPLLLGAFVHVEIDAGTLEQVYDVPRMALRDGDRVFTVDAERKLRARDIEVAWRAKDSVYVRAGLQPGDKVIVSRLAAPVEGMLVRLGAAVQQAGQDGAPSMDRQ